MKFIQRNTQPLKTNKYYNKPKAFSSPNLDMWVLGGNCTDYAWCRYREALEDMNGSKNLPTSAADRWYTDAIKKGLKTGQTAKLGAIACFKNHVAVVENLYGNKQVLSAGGYTKLKSTRYLFKLKTIGLGATWNGKKFYGYIYPPKDFDEDLPADKCNWKVMDPRYVRVGPGTEYAIKKVKDLSKDGQNHCTSKNKNAKAQYKNGTIFTNKKSVKAVNGSIWAQTPSGYVCLISSKGKAYCKIV